MTDTDTNPNPSPAFRVIQAANIQVEYTPTEVFLSLEIDGMETKLTLNPLDAVMVGAALHSAGQALTFHSIKKA